jgi:PTH1 family peptidyl-tRNA hydrolase
MPIQLIVGLANPGKEYAATRHNVGAWWLQALCDQNHINLQAQSKLQAVIGQGSLQQAKFRCAIPTTYMNHSGQAVAKISQYFDIPAEEILVVHDELDFAPGVIRLKFAGGHGGHNGLRDIIPQLGSEKFHRLRIGIGHPGNKDLVADYVLGNPSKHDQKIIETAIQDSLNLLPAILAGDWQTAMNQLHQV